MDVISKTSLLLQEGSLVSNYLCYQYDNYGRVVGVWQNEETYEKLNRYYGPKGDSFAYWTGGTNLSNEVVHYQHTDYLGTVKIRTDQNHNIEGSYSDFPFGEQNSSGTDDNTEHYAMLDRDTESDTHHAQFRTYEPRIGRWLQPDPYNGSYDASSPQSWNRYNYVMNNPLGLTDPTGLICSFGSSFGPPNQNDYRAMNDTYASCVASGGHWIDVQSVNVSTGPGLTSTGGSGASGGSLISFFFPVPSNQGSTGERSILHRMPQVTQPRPQAAKQQY